MKTLHIEQGAPFSEAGFEGGLLVRISVVLTLDCLLMVATIDHHIGVIKDGLQDSMKYLTLAPTGCSIFLPCTKGHRKAYEQLTSLSNYA